jgi:hypothetical protein
MSQNEDSSPERGDEGSGDMEPDLLEPTAMIQSTPQMKILVAIEAVDGRKYAPSIDMRSLVTTGR